MSTTPIPSSPLMIKRWPALSLRSLANTAQRFRANAVKSVISAFKRGSSRPSNPATFGAEHLIETGPLRASDDPGEGGIRDLIQIHTASADPRGIASFLQITQAHVAHATLLAEICVNRKPLRPKALVARVVNEVTNPVQRDILLGAFVSASQMASVPDTMARRTLSATPDTHHANWYTLEHRELAEAAVIAEALRFPSSNLAAIAGPTTGDVFRNPADAANAAEILTKQLIAQAFFPGANPKAIDLVADIAKKTPNTEMRRILLTAVVNASKQADVLAKVLAVALGASTHALPPRTQLEELHQASMNAQVVLHG